MIFLVVSQGVIQKNLIIKSKTENISSMNEHLFGVQTPQEFLYQRRLSRITYFALALNFSYPVLEVLLFLIEPEEVVVMKRVMETTKEIKVKGRWIKRSYGDLKFVFLFSKPRNVCLWVNKRREATAVFLGQMTIVGERRYRVLWREILEQLIKIGV